LNKLTHCLYLTLLKKPKTLFLDYSNPAIKDYAIKVLRFTENINAKNRLIFKGKTGRTTTIKSGAQKKKNTRKVVKQSQE